MHGTLLALMPAALIFVAVSPFSGTLSRHLGVRFMIGGSLAIISSGLLLIGLGAH